MFKPHEFAAFDCTTQFFPASYWLHGLSSRANAQSSKLILILQAANGFPARFSFGNTLLWIRLQNIQLSEGEIGLSGDGLNQLSTRRPLPIDVGWNQLRIEG
jgi:hypothetical protein